MTPYTTADLPELKKAGTTALVVTDDEPEFGHVYGVALDGTYQPLVDVHLPCGDANSWTVRMGDGSLRHMCRTCTLKAATGKED